MKAIILAAWEWSRLRPITNTIPKPMIQICGKTILEYNLEAIYEEVNEIIIVVKYKKEIIEEYFKDNYKWVKITYIEQWEEKWTWWALKSINVNDDVIILYWDSILDKDDIKKVIECKNYAWLVKEVESPEKYWIYKTDEKWLALELVEKPSEYIWNLANLGWFKFSPEFFKYIEKTPLSIRWEYELPCALNLFLKNNSFELIKISGEFIDIGYPEDIEKAENILKKKINKFYKVINIFPINLSIKKTKIPKFWEVTEVNKIEVEINDKKETLKIYLWINLNRASQLIYYSKTNENILKFTPSDRLERFKDIDNLKNWYNDDDINHDKPRYLFCLINPEEKLVWIYWWRKAELPIFSKVEDENKDIESILEQENKKGNIFTNWIRIYEWQWLWKTFLRESDKLLRTFFPSAIISTDVKADNDRSNWVFEKSGYKALAKWQNKNTSNKIVASKDRIIYISLPIEN